MRKYVFAALIAGALATPAMAQDKGAFTGIKVEGLAGWDHAKVPGYSDDGILYGIGAGYDFQTGGVVLGLETEASDSTVDKCVTGFVAAGDRICTKAGRDLYAGARVGGLVGANTLLYAKAGYTNGRYGSDYTAPTGGTGSFSLHQNLDGIRFGGGVEHKVGSNMFVKAEYRYSNYEQGVERHQAVAGFGVRF